MSTILSPLFETKSNNIPHKETWDEIALNYSDELDDGEISLADEIAAILKYRGILPGANLIELGCGSGHLSARLAMLGYKVTLLDFSSIAITKAKQTFEKYGLKGSFIQGDLMNLSPVTDTYDLVWNSGVMEHFGDKELGVALQNMASLSKNDLMILVPNPESISYLLMRAQLMGQNKWTFGTEYLRYDYEVYFQRSGLGNVDKKYIYTPAISNYFMSIADQPEGQCKNIYSELMNELLLPSRENYLMAFWAIKKESPICELDNYVGDTALKTRIFDLTSQNIGLHLMTNQIQNELNKYKEHLKQTKTELQEREEELQRAKIDLVDREEELLRTKTELLDWEDKLKKTALELKEKTDILNKAIVQCSKMLTSRMFKIVHLVNRIIRQGIHGTKEEKIKFKKWFISRFQKVPNLDHQYNPIYGIINILNEHSLIESGASWFEPKKEINETICMTQKYKKIKEEEPHLSDNLKLILKKVYNKFDVIILAIIDYDFRYQRPQHFATRLAVNGHRVFYINANHHMETSISAVKENLNVVNFNNQDASAIYFTDWEQNFSHLKQHLDTLIHDYSIRDAIVIVDYPNWVHGAKYLNERFGFKIITDYMDDFTGFINPSEKLIKENCIKLLTKSSAVVASSQFLYEIASKYNNNINIVRNGTEYKHFHKAFGLILGNQRKIIGYYGAIAEWFDVNKVCYIAKNLPDCDIILIGDVTAGRGYLKKYPNISLLGEMPYMELPEQLEKFDVCIIPFDTTTDLIKATNPVKFYEYLSAGKKIVATEIPELEPFRDKYVYLTNDNEEFLKYIKLCLAGEDTLSIPAESAEFGKLNDWQHRYEDFIQICEDSVPKVSIIVLTYNNMKLNKLCIQSILDKTAYPRYELIIVDNQSTDGTREYLKELKAKAMPHVKIILNEKNSGFAGGNNIGIRAATGDYVLLLNNDTIVTRGWLTSLVKHPENDPRVGLCGPVTNSIGNEAKISVTYHDIDGIDEFAEKYTWEHMGEEWKDPGVLALFCTLIKKEVIEKCGLLDESYKVGMFEDDDYSESVKRAGYNLTIAEDSFIHHFDGATFKKLEDEKYREIFENNKHYYEEKWSKKWVAHQYRNEVSKFLTIN